ncbi:MAG: vanadium-dependent haloperoxidase [Chitinophagaceae bacterium]
MRLSIYTAILILMAASCTHPNDYTKITGNPLLFTHTVHELNQIVMGNNFGPIVASRNYYYASVAAYEVIAAGYPRKFESLSGQLHGLGVMPKPVNVNIDFDFGALLAFCSLGEAVTFPAGSMREYTDSLKQLVSEHGMSPEILGATSAFADSISAVILAWSKKDNYAESRSYPKYSVLDSPGRWTPTPPAYADAMEPHWNSIRTAVVDSVNEFIPPPPYIFDITHPDSSYYKEVKKIKDKVDSLSPEEAHIADFWDDNPFKLNVSGHVMFSTKKFSPGGHWMGIAGIAAEKSGADYPTTVCGFAKTAIALFDAFIECWNIKYIYNTLRPETAINKYLDPEWRPHLQTPPFPEYTCGHCTISAASAEVLTSVYGDHFKYTDSTEMEFGIDSRHFGSFRDAANETMQSRFYGGIHYLYCCERSNVMGARIGKLIAQRLKMQKEK